jgi:transposase
MKITTIGLDIAKSVLHAVGFDERQHEVFKKCLKREDVMIYFAQLPPCVVIMETCGGAHYWHQQLTRVGHTVKLIAAQHVRAYVRGNKNDYNDARAIAEAGTRPGMRFVIPKTAIQNTLQSVLRMRELQIAQRTALTNQLRGLLAEHGIVFAKGLATLRSGVCELLGQENSVLPAFLRQLFATAYEQWLMVETFIAQYNCQLKQVAKEEANVKRLCTIPGFGCIVASAFVSVIGDGKAFQNGRGVSACLGLVPRQHSSGGKEVLLGISKRGDTYLRSVLIHGARSVIQHASKRSDRLSRWVQRLCESRGKNVATVALANKMARIGWAVLHQQGEYVAQPA